MNHLDHTSGKVTLLDNETTVIAEITPWFIWRLSAALYRESRIPLLFSVTNK